MSLPTSLELKRLRDKFVHVAGAPVSWAVEEHDDVQRIDHVWITVRAGDFGLIRISLSTRSIKSRDAGFDERMRLGISTTDWIQLPVVGVSASEPFAYADIDRPNSIAYKEIEDLALQTLLIDKAKRAVLIEAWGDLYIRNHVGLHQVHSRGASFAVPRDIVGRDGAIRFYHPDNRAEMLLMKFAGQP